MDNVKDKILNYEVMPPRGIWESIAAELDTKKQPALVIPISGKKNKKFYYIAAAAACVIIIFSVIFINKNSGKKEGEGFFSSFFSSSSSSHDNSLNSTANNDTSSKNNDHVFITVPTDDSTVNTADNSKDDDKMVAQNTPSRGGPLEKKYKDADNKTDSSDNLKDTLANDNRPVVKPGQFLTIAGTEGQSIKVSSKAAMLIDSSDNKIPPKLIWNKKISQWREIMKGNTLAPTPGNFLDIIELTKTLKDK